MNFQGVSIVQEKFPAGQSSFLSGFILAAEVSRVLAAALGACGNASSGFGTLSRELQGPVALWASTSTIHVNTLSPALCPSL